MTEDCLHLSVFIKPRIFQFISLLFLVFMGGCSPRTGIENFPELTFTKFPAPNASRVPINSKIQLFFNSPLDKDSLNPSLFILMDPSGNPVPAKMDYLPLPASGGSVLTLTPLSYSQTPPVYLNINSVYTVTLGGGIKTAAGDSMTLLNVWTFATNNSPDITPPTFGGIISAEGVDMGSVKITWGPAVDNPGGTPPSQLIFSICSSSNSTICVKKFVPVIYNPSSTRDSNGNYTFIIKPLRPETTYYFVVRVEDFAGNRDSNTIQVTGKTLGGKLYVANLQNNEILALDHLSTLALNNAPRSIKASQNGLLDPYGIFYDQVNNRLFIATCKTTTTNSLIESLTQVNCVSGSSKIVVYNNTSTLPGKDQLPDWTVINSSLNGPIGIFLDNSSGRDTLYVANFVGRSVTIYDKVTMACMAVLVNGTCSITPRVNFKSPDLVTPFGITYDSGKQLLYVSNYIQSFQSTDTNGNIIPIVSGSTVAIFSAFQLSSQYNGTSAYKAISGFGSPAGLWLDSSQDILYVSNPVPNLGSSSTLKYPGIAAICNVSLVPTGTQPPLPGSMTFTTPLPGSSTCTPTTAGAQFLAGSNTGFLWPVQIAITNSSNSSTPSLYVSDFNRNVVDVFSPNPLFSASSVYYDTPPNERLFGLNNEIKKPVGIAVSDSSGMDSLMVSNLGWDQIIFFDKVAQNYSLCTGASAPLTCNFPFSRDISASIFGPGGVFLNNTPDRNGVPRDRLYISNFLNNTIVVLDGASTLNGNVFGSIYKIITSSALQNPFGIYVDTSQSREWIYVVNSRKDITGFFSVVVFDLSLCPGNTLSCNLDTIPNGVRVIHSADFSSPAGIWIDEGNDTNNKPRDILFVSNRGNSSGSSPGFITMFNSTSVLSGSISASKIIQGDQTSLFIPTGIFMDPVKDTLYIANQGYNDILVFNQPQSCAVSLGTNLCNVPPDRTIFNAADIAHSLDAPSAIVINFSADQLYLANLGISSHLSSLLVIDGASQVNGQAFIADSLVANVTNLSTFPLNLPEALALDITR